MPAGRRRDLLLLLDEDSRHANHIEKHGTVALTIWGSDQPEYSPDTTATLQGVQIRGEAARLTEDEYPDAVVGAIDALDAPMPPYAAFEIEPHRV